jgi:amino acid adenylation domain-containing protein
MAESQPEAPAVVDASGLALTYAELVSRAGRLAAHLRRLGVGPESLVPVCLDRSPELVVALLGVLEAGAAWVPLDPSIPRERLGALLADLPSGTPLLARHSLAGRLPAGDRRIVWLDELDPAEASLVPPIEDFAESPAYVIYTSGSTGRPKGVVVSHGALATFTAAAAELYGLGPADRVLQLASQAFDASIEEIWPCLVSGGTVVLRDEEMLATAAGFLARCRDQRLTVLDLPTAFWHELAVRMDREGLSLPESVRCVILGGERALPERAALWWRQKGTAGVRLFNTYGPTEATVVATAAALDPAAEGGWRELPIGRPLRGVEAWVVEPGLRLAPAGLPGELLLGGAALARGYLGRPELTAERFVPGEHGARLYRTGDLVRWRPDGALEFLGRIDQQVKIRGFRVEPGEIETALRRHPAVREAVVAAREDGPGGLRLVAWYTVEPGLDPAPSELRAFLQDSLPDYMVPAAFIHLDELPLTPGGKVDRRALPAPEKDRADRPYEAPRNEAEEVLAAIFAEVLGVGRIGVGDDFFELGGHSLLLPQVLHRIREDFDVEVPLRSLYEEPTVAGLAVIVEDLILQQIESLEVVE